MKRIKLIKILGSIGLVSGITTIPFITTSCSDPHYDIPSSIEIWGGPTEFSSSASFARLCNTPFYWKCNPVGNADPHVQWKVYNDDGTNAPNWISCDNQGYLYINANTTNTDIGQYRLKVQAESVVDHNIKSNFSNIIEVEIYSDDSQFIFTLNNDNTAYNVSAAPGISGVVTIPTTHNDLPVIPVLQGFMGCQNITEVVIPDNITSWPDYVFGFCDNLTKIVIGNGVTGVHDFLDCPNITDITIGSSVTSLELGSSNTFDRPLTHITNVTNNSPSFVWATNMGANCHALLPASSGGIYNFYSYNVQIISGILYGDLEIPEGINDSCGSTFGNSSITSIKFPSTMTTLLDFCDDCYSLNSITFGTNISKIYQGFTRCHNLTTISFPTSITETSGCFGSCDRLASITWPDGLLTIGSGSFQNCSALATINIPNSAVVVGDSAFYGCTNLTSITIGSNVSTILRTAFSNCPKLTNVINNSPSFVWATNMGANCHALLKQSSNGIFDWNKPGCQQLVGGQDNSDHGYAGLIYGKLEIPDNIASIAKNIFWGSALNEVVLSGGMSTVSESAFNDCENLTNITFGNGVSSIDTTAFINCYNLSTFTIPSNITSIAYNAFVNCNFVNVTNNSPSFVWATNMGANCKCLLLANSGGVFDWSKRYQAIGYILYGSLVIPNGVTVVGDEVIDSSNITAVSFPNTLKSIGKYAFASCKLTTLTLPDSLITIDNSAFDGCSNLIQITFGNKLQSIGDYAFQHCYKITQLNFPSSINHIGNYAFAYTSSFAHPKSLLSNVYFKGDVINVFSVFQGASMPFFVHVPEQYYLKWHTKANAQSFGIPLSMIVGW